MGRRKSRGKRRPLATTVAAPSVSFIPLLSDEHNDAATAFDSDGDRDGENHYVIHHRRRQAEPEHVDSEPEPVDFFDETICIHCDNRGEEKEKETVLICGGSGKDCPVAVHASCLGSEPKFDDSGNFCCAYCWYKRSLDTCRRLRKKAEEAKRELELSCVLDNPNRHARVNLVVKDCEELVEETGREGQAQCEENKDVEGEVQEIEKLQKERGIETEAQPQENKEEDVVEEMEMEKEGRGAEENKEMETEAEARFEENREEGEGRVGADYNAASAACVSLVRRVVETETETGVQSEEKKDEEGKVNAPSSSVNETNDLESEAKSVKKKKKKKVVSRRKSSLLQQEPKNTPNTRGKIAKEEEVTSFRTPSLRQQPKRMSQTSLTAKRKRLGWTAEEEEFLREGVSKLSTKNHNISWRKILEFGCDVFDKTRTPIDLKDKWKNIVSKEGRKN